MVKRHYVAAIAALACIAVFLCACGGKADDAQEESAVAPWSEAKAFSMPEWTQEETEATAAEEASSSAAQKGSASASKKDADATTKKASAATTKKSATDPQTALQRIDAARAVYSLFIDAKPVLDREQSIEEEEIVFYRVADPDLDTMDKLAALVRRYFSEDITQSLLGTEMYREMDGALYVPDVGQQITDGTPLKRTVEVEQTAKDVETYTLTVQWDKDGDGKADETESYVFLYGKEDGKPVFTQFEMY